MLGNHHDAWVFGATDPNSGTSVFLEVLSSLPKRAIVSHELFAFARLSESFLNSPVKDGFPIVGFVSAVGTEKSQV